MTSLTKGANAPLPTTRLTVSVDVAADADLSALLLTAAGKVRTEDDFVFYNAPHGPGVDCRQPQGGQGWQVDVDLDAVPDDVAMVRLVTSLDDHGRVFGQVGQPVARVVDAAGAVVAEFAMTGLSSESIVVALELYRRQGAWKVRAVGQGYAGGLDALLGDHGVEVSDPPAPPPPSAPAAPAAPAPPPPAAPAPPPAPTTTGVNLVKGRPVSLVKGQSVNLVKDGGRALTQVRMGLGWDAISRSRMFGSREVDVDLDASAVLYADRTLADLAFYNNLSSKDGSIVHMGDNRTGAGDGDDEVVSVDLTRIPVHVTSVVFVVTSYQGQTFEQVQNAFCRIVDHADGELARYSLAGGMPFTGLVMAKLYRAEGIWKFQAIGEGISAKTPLDALPLLERFL